MAGRAAYLPSSINGGARKAEEVTAQVTVSAISGAGPSLAPATKGRPIKAAPLTIVTAATQ